MTAYPNSSENHSKKHGTDCVNYRSYSILSTFHLVASQPNGGESEMCLTSFIPSNGNSPKWYDRPCFENDVIGEKGHKFMCEVEELSGKKHKFFIVTSQVKIYKNQEAQFLSCLLHG